MFRSISFASADGSHWMGLKTYFTLDHSRDSPDVMSKLFLHVCMDIVGVVFAFSVLGLVWSIFMPAWIERLVRFAVDHFVVGLAALLCVILGMFAFVWFTMYRT
jgi:hypothetical protein